MPCVAAAVVALTPAAEAANASGSTIAAPAVPAPADGPTMFDIVFPVTVLLLLGLVIPAFMMGLNQFLTRRGHGTKNTNPGKILPYEAGMTATVGGADERFSVKFYLIAMLFLAFDLEVAFLYPWAIHFSHSRGWGMVWLLVTFLAMLEVGYLYLYKKGALDWDR